MAETSLHLSAAVRSIPSTQRSRLLTIPGEIRNRIYELAIQDANAWQNEDFRHVTDYHERQNKLFDFRNSKLAYLKKLSGKDQQELNWSSLKRQYLGLTQVCRQLRTEFLPMSFGIWVSVDFCDAHDYVEQASVRQAQHAKTTVCLEINVDGRQGCFDARSFLLTYYQSTHLCIRFCPQKIPEDLPYDHRILEHFLLNAKTLYPKWCDFIAEKAIEVQPVIRSSQWSGTDSVSVPFSYIHGMETLLEPEFAEDWMAQNMPNPFSAFL